MERSHGKRTQKGGKKLQGESIVRLNEKAGHKKIREAGPKGSVGGGATDLQENCL